MTDRVPGAPGQYILTVSAAEAQKILTGEQVTVTLKRDDQPLVEGTPYNKASVLPDELAAMICPGISDPTPADAYVGLLKRTAPYKYAHNSDFTQWIAQPGLCKSHAGSVAIYAGDRWILDSGTVTGDAREDGNGYRNITLNGTIRQIVANAPDVGTAAIEMVSGTADISYTNGEITITSNGGVIKNVRLFKGNYTADNMPVHQPKGYNAELEECQLYYRKINNAVFSGYISGAGKFIRTDGCIPAMRTVPTVSYDMTLTVRTHTGYSTYASYNDPKKPTGMSAGGEGLMYLGFDFAEVVGTNNTLCSIQTRTGTIELSADL